ncbi:hypothetical protein HJC23_002323 [Cyclotella cryptica]|uniref:G-patch domain-containing protein n=1 Tax=Cyclotella cryptica TaxID=29204 RepID=A0ABD3QSN6_9STRA|eukprot:CCRYP_004392-RA/>CCRYP_004392-RA protein AED:0.01 eAED:0.01 QI:0/-1/0/1/-1/1/1/0/250
MTIVATADTRNSQWSKDPSSYGRKMLEKMGWKGDSHGLGKNQQGTTTNLRAIRRAESLGIGAETDAFGSKGWEDTNRGFHGVLATLQKEYGGINSGENDEETKKRRRKEEKKRKKKEEKQKEKAKTREAGSDSDGNTLRLAQNKVQAGHARKMREAKDIRNKSAEDMAAVFGVKADIYKSLNSGANNKCEAVEKDSCSNSIERKDDDEERKGSNKRKSKSKDVVLEQADGKSNDGERQKKKNKKDKKSKV